jgi:hypothetical protein
MLITTYLTRLNGYVVFWRFDTLTMPELSSSHKLKNVGKVNHQISVSVLRKSFDHAFYMEWRWQKMDDWRCQQWCWSLKCMILLTVTLGPLSSKCQVYSPCSHVPISFSECDNRSFRVVQLKWAMGIVFLAGWQMSLTIDFVCCGKWQQKNLILLMYFKNTAKL